VCDESSSEPTPIDSFRKEWAFLSNFYPCKVFYGLHYYVTVEHAFQAAKTVDQQEREKIRKAASPFLAKRFGQNVTLRYGWDAMKLEIMSDLLWQKFILNHELRARLLATGDRELIEGNTWQDFYWGVCDGVGKNYLGRLLMALRAVARLVVNADAGNAGKAES
jgi:hypothetical protein